MVYEEIDYKKTEKDLYQPKTTPSIINVLEMTFITVDGKGDPNTSAEYTAAVELLYGLSYTIKMGNKSILEYVVPPLEGFFTFGGGSEMSIHDVRPKVIRRIISLVPSATEILYFLGIEACVIGVTELSSPD